MENRLRQSTNMGVDIKSSSKGWTIPNESRDQVRRDKGEIWWCKSYLTNSISGELTKVANGIFFVCKCSADQIDK